MSLHSSTIPMAVVVMGPSGTGKSTIGLRLAKELRCRFAEGDDYHSAGNVHKMAAGVPLTDEDRLPWLRRLRTEVIETATAESGVVIACSALRRAYRDLLRADSSGNSGKRQIVVFFVELFGDFTLIAQRIKGRRHAYMPASLLGSQYAALQPLQLENGELGLRISVAAEPEEIVRRVTAALRQWKQQLHL